MSGHPVFDPNDAAAADCYRTALRALAGAGVGVLVGGGFAFARHTGIRRQTKDFDLFLRPADRDRALAALAAAGFRTEVTYPHWLAKAFRDDHFVDLISNAGNGAGAMDDGWFAHAEPAELFGEPVRLCPAEEMVWQKTFIMERDRFDGADVAHVFRALGPRLDWPRLLARFGPHWRVLLAHVVLFGFIYPGERDRIPAWVEADLLARLRADEPSPADARLCRGTMLCVLQFLPDVEEWGYRDARLPPDGPLTPADVAVWTDGVRAGR